MRKLLSLICATSLLMLTACNKNTNTKVEDEYIKDRVLMEYTLDTSIYGNAIEDAILVHKSERNDVIEFIDNYSYLLTENFKSYMIESSFIYEEDNMDQRLIDSFNPGDGIDPETGEIIDEEIYTNNNNNQQTHPEIYEPDENTYIPEPGLMNPDDGINWDEIMNENEDEAEKEVSANTILNNFIAFGYENETTDNDSNEEYAINESWMDEEWTQQQDEEAKVYEVIAIDAYKDRLVCSVIYKYGSPMKVVVDLVDGKIDGYTIYR